MGPKKKGESLSEYWERSRQLMSGLVGARFRRARDADETKQRKWHDFFNRMCQLCSKTILGNKFNDESQDLPENKWDRRLKNTLSLASAFMVPYALNADDLEEDLEAQPT